MPRSIFRHFYHLLRQTRRPARSTRLRVEGLEERRNPVSATWNAVDGILRVSGSSTVNDRIFVRQDNSPSGPVLGVFDARTGVFVTIQNSPTSPTTIAVAAVVGIEVTGAGGNDFLDLNSAAGGFQSITVPATIIGGSGVDSLAGGDGNDSIIGGDNADLIFGNEGDDTILGQGGDDAIFGSAGQDSLLGGSGND
jgi:Ca2+-binding RTX toxin-like protein